MLVISRVLEATADLLTRLQLSDSHHKSGFIPFWCHSFVWLLFYAKTFSPEPWWR